MENVTKYLPWIIGAVVLVYVLRKLTTKTSFLPQTQFVETPQTDPYAEARTKAFDLITGLGIAQTQADLERSRLAEGSALERLKLGVERETSLAAIAAGKDVSLSRIELENRLANLSYLQRSQDTQLQQGAIDRYYSSRNTQSIVGSISQALSGIFGNKTPNVFGTPPTFPRNTFDFGGFF